MKHIFGIRNGYQGFYKPELQPPLALSPKAVENIHDEGGTMLGTSRGTLLRALTDTHLHIERIFACSLSGLLRASLSDAGRVGGFELDPIIESIQRNKYDVLFCIGGDGTLRAATAISEAIKRLHIPVAVRCAP